jgi:hypothetical protein
MENKTMSYKEEHPDWIAPSDFRLDELEKLGFKDISWRNDAYPFWGHYKHGFTLGVDYEKGMSDWGHLSNEFYRFHLYKRELGEGEKEHECLHDDAEHIISSNTFADIIKAIKEKIA